MTRLITGVGRYLPGPPVLNDHLLGGVTDFDVDRSATGLDRWIREHYGVRARHWAAEGESSGDMALEAARRALSSARLDPARVDLIVMATATSDSITPHSVSRVQAGLEGCNAVFIQLQDACAGFLNALQVADSMMANLGYRRALVLAAEKMSDIVDRSRFRMVGLFGDGAGAVVLEDVPPFDGEEAYGFRSFYAGSDGRRRDAVLVPSGGSRRPLTAARLAAGEQYLVTDFQAIYPFAVETFQTCVREATSRASLRIDQLDWVLPHHASRNILQDAAAASGIEPERLVVALEHAGNTSSASVAIAWAELAASGNLRDGDRLLLLSMGGGLAWASAVYVWRDPQQLERDA